MLRTPDRIVVGIIVGTHGIRGEMRVKPLTDFPERFSKTAELLAVHLSGNSVILHPERARLQGEIIVLKCTELNSIEEVKPWVGSELSISKEELTELPEGRYYIFQLMGLKVYTEEGLYLGEISDVLFPGANDVYVVSLSAEAKAKAVDSNGKELLLPVIDQVILETNLEHGRMIVRLLEGLL